MQEDPNKVSTPETIKTPEQAHNNKQKDLPENHPGPNTREEFYQKVNKLEREFQTAIADKKISPELKKELESKLKEEIAMERRLYEKNLTLPERIKGSYTDGIDRIFHQLKTDPGAIERVKFALSLIIADTTIAQHMGDNTQDKLFADLDACALLKDKNEFTQAMSKALEPLINCNLAIPRQFEDIQARASMTHFIPLNDRLSYGVGGPYAHFHLAPSYTIPKEELREMFLDGMKKLATVTKDNPDIKVITGSSWIVATKSYSAMLKSIGFEIEDVSDEEKQMYFPDETREVKKAVMSREKFIETFDKK